MGFPYNELIPAAILLDNPGITKEEFVNLLDRTHSSSIHQFNKYAKFSSFGGKYEDKQFHQGLWGLASLLSMRYREEYKKFNTPHRDGNKLLINSPTFFFEVHKRKGKWEFRFEVSTHERNILEEAKRVKQLAWGKLKIGDIWVECQMGAEHGLVEKIYEEIPLSKEDEDDLGSSPRYEYDMDIKPFYGIGKIQKFSSFEKLREKWPQFDPEFMYNFSQKNGNIRAGPLDRGGFRWVQRGGKYYLDEDTFNHIPASFSVSRSMGYNDLILTSLAIKKKAWKLLSYRGLVHIDQFFRKYPELLGIREKAVWDSHTSLSAKKDGLSHSEFLRWRIYSTSNIPNINNQNLKQKTL